MTLSEQIKQHKPRSIFDHIGREIFSPDFSNPAEMAYIESGNCYEWYYAIGRTFCPPTILEIGVRYGYSLAALVAGSGASTAEGMDVQAYESDSNKHAMRFMGQLFPKTTVEIGNINSQEINRVRFRQLVHIDGDHSFHGKIHDLMLAWMSGARTIVVDDYDFLKDVRNATDHFLKGMHPYRYETAYLPSYRGTLVIQRV